MQLGKQNPSGCAGSINAMESLDASRLSPVTLHGRWTQSTSRQRRSLRHDCERRFRSSALTAGRLRPPRSWVARPVGRNITNWRALRDELRTFLSEFLSALPRAEFQPDSVADMGDVCGNPYKAVSARATSKLVLGSRLQLRLFALRGGPLFGLDVRLGRPKRESVQCVADHKLVALIARISLPDNRRVLRRLAT